MLIILSSEEGPVGRRVDLHYFESPILIGNLQLSVLGRIELGALSVIFLVSFLAN